MRRAMEVGLPVVAVLGVAAGGFVGLTLAPADRDMGDVMRIMYVHVPSAWMAFIAGTVTFVSSLIYLIKGSWAADATAAASGEVGLFFGALALCLGSIWARPTWGTWWEWDPRLTMTALLVLMLAGYQALRRFVEDPERRATWSAVVGVIIMAAIVLDYFAVRLFPSIHQTQSSPATLARSMTMTLRANAFAFLFMYLWLLRTRYRIERRRLNLELAEPPATGS